MINIEEMATFCKRKGIVYPSADIYGGLNGFFDFGPLGVEIKNNIKQSFWKKFVHQRDDVVGIDGSIVTNPKVWEASGHVDCFEDILVECKKCKSRFRADHLIEDALNIQVEHLSSEEMNKIIIEKELSCSKCGTKEWGEPKKFNLMFSTQVGPVGGNMSYLRPETAQLIFTNFKLVMDNARMKLPFGICQIGKAFRNEISPRDFMFRSREFEQMEIEFFTHPDKKDDCPDVKDYLKRKVKVLTATSQEANESHKETTVEMMIENNIIGKWHAYWLMQMYDWFLEMGIKEENIRFREHLKDELAHYAGACFDIEYHFPFGWKEIHGNADRKQFDIKQHIEHSRKDLSVFDEESKQKVVPYVASEPSQGVDRAFLAFLFDAYDDDKERGNIVLNLSSKLSPYKVAVFPLVNKEGIPELAKDVHKALSERFNCLYDRGGSVGRRYARNDEMGTPYCITVDFDSLTNKDVTIRDRTSTKQIRVDIEDLSRVIGKLVDKEILFEKAGKLL